MRLELCERADECPPLWGGFFKEMRLYNEEQLYQVLGDTLILDELV